MATISKRGKRWYVQVRRKGYPPSFKTLGSKAEAVAWARVKEAALGPNPEPVLRPRKRPWERFWSDTGTPSRQRSEGPLANPYRLSRMIAAPMALLTLGQVQPAHIAAYRDERLKEVKPGTVRRELAVLRSALETARREWGLALENPAAKSRGRSLMTLGTVAYVRVNGSASWRPLRVVGTANLRPSWASPLRQL